MIDHWFWLLLTVAVIIWYSTITVFVTIKGAADIKSMLGNLKALNDENADSPAEGLPEKLPSEND